MARSVAKSVTHSVKVTCHRVYDKIPKSGYRVLVDRVWPRGIRKEALQLDEWYRELAPSSALRKWFDHDPEKWQAFCRRYHTELESRGDDLDALQQRCGKKTLRLLYAARDTDHNNAIALKSFIESR